MRRCDGLFLRAVFGFYRERAAAVGLPGGRTGAVNRIQRFGSALNWNVHFHAILLDGVYTAASPFEHLMRRVFDVDVLLCGVCHSLRRLIAVITQRNVIVKILAHLELETDPSPMQPARAPPQLELAF